MTQLVETWQWNYKLAEAWQYNYKLLEAWQCNYKLSKGFTMNWKLFDAWQCKYKLVATWQCNYYLWRLYNAIRRLEAWQWSVQKGFKSFCGFHLKERPKATKYNEFRLNFVEKIWFGKLCFVNFYYDNFHIFCLAGGAALGDDPPGGVCHRGSRSTQSPQTAHHPGPESQTGGPQQTDEQAILVPTNWNSTEQ